MFVVKLFSFAVCWFQLSQAFGIQVEYRPPDLLKNDDETSTDSFNPLTNMIQTIFLERFPAPERENELLVLEPANNVAAAQNEIHEEDLKNEFLLVEPANRFVSSQDGLLQQMFTLIDFTERLIDDEAQGESLQLQFLPVAVNKLRGRRRHGPCLHSCRSDVLKLCGNQVGAHSQIIGCLQSQYEFVSDDCKKTLNKQSIFEHCIPDIERNCPDASWSGGKMIQCLKLAKISKECSASLQKLRTPVTIGAAVPAEELSRRYYFKVISEFLIVLLSFLATLLCYMYLSKWWASQEDDSDEDELIESMGYVPMSDVTGMDNELKNEMK